MVYFSKYFFKKLTKTTTIILSILCSLAIAVIFVEILSKTTILSTQNNYLFLTITISLIKFITPSLPICFALAIVLVFIQLTQTQEHLAAKTLGLSYCQQLKWCFSWGLIAAALCLLLTNLQPTLIKIWQNSQKHTEQIAQLDLPAYSIQNLSNNTIVTTSKPVKNGTYQKILLVELTNTPKAKLQIWQANAANVKLAASNKTWQLVNGNIYKLNQNKASFQTLRFKTLNYITLNKNNIIHIDKHDTSSLTQLYKENSIDAKKAIKEKIDPVLMCLVLSICAFISFVNKPRQHAWLKAVPLLCVILLYMLTLKLSTELINKTTTLGFNMLLACSHIIILSITALFAKLYNKHL